MTDAGEVVEKHGVSIGGIKNIPGMLPTSSTWMYAHNIYNFIAFLCDEGKVSVDTSDPIIGSSLTTIDKKIVHAGAIDAGL